MGRIESAPEFSDAVMAKLGNNMSKYLDNLQMQFDFTTSEENEAEQTLWDE